MPVKPRDSNGPMSLAEQRIDELLGQAKPWASRIDEPDELDVHADSHAPDQQVRGEYLARKLLDSPDEGGWRLFWRRNAQPPVIRIQDCVITGAVDLRGSDLPYLLEFVRCRFEQAPDVWQAEIGGLVISHCFLPGLRARNLTTKNDAMLLGCTVVGGAVNLTDARIGGSLDLCDTTLSNPADRAINAPRLSVGGALRVMGTQVTGALRIPGAHIGGNLNLNGAHLHNPGMHALSATGIEVTGSLRASLDNKRGSGFRAEGVIDLASARLSHDLRMSAAKVDPGATRTFHGESTHDDPASALILDRGDIQGDVQLDKEFHSTGTIRMVSTKIGGDLRMADSRIDLSWLDTEKQAPDRPTRAVHIDGAQILGNLEAPGAVVRGQLRMVDARIAGSFLLNNATLDAPRTDVVQANRIGVGNNLDCREAEIAGTVQLQAANVGANVDLRGTRLAKPSWHRHREKYKPSLDVRAATIGRDLICAEGSQPFSAEGEVHLRRASVARHTNFWRVRLGAGKPTNAVHAFGLTTQELTLLPVEAPHGRVLLRQAQCELFDDNAALWAATGSVDVEDFTFDNFSHPVKPTDTVRVHERLEWLRTAMDGRYQPGPYDQLATVFRENGNEEHAVTVLIAKQRRRYQAIADASRRALRGPVLLWSLLQRVTVSYGYRPVRALLWLLVFAAAGTGWFAYHRLQPINEDDHPVWNPFLYTIDQLLPIINLGHDVMWQAHGYSQWITVVLIAAGWILATTVAAGISRSLRREH